MRLLPLGVRRIGQWGLQGPTCISGLGATCLALDRKRHNCPGCLAIASELESRAGRAGGRYLGGHARLLLSALLFAACTSTNAFADTYESAVARGIAAKERALETNSTGDWQEALELFTAAVSLDATKEAQFEFAEAAAQLHLDDEAFDGYRLALAQGLSGKAAERAQQFVDAHAHAFGTLDVKGPSGARLYINGRKRGVLPLARPLSVAVGTLRIQVDVTGFRSWERELIMDAEDDTVLDLSLEPAMPTAPSQAPPAPPAPAAPRAPRDPATKAAPRTWEVPTLIAGGGLALIGTTGAIVTSVLLTDRRKTLKSNCAVLEADQCRATTSTRLNAAQSAADDVVTFERLRWASVGVAAVGLGAVVVSAWRLSSRAGSHAAAGGGSIQLSSHEVGLQWAGEF